MKIIFASTNSEFMQCIQAAFADIPFVEFFEGDIQSIDVFGKAFVSPANCLGFMDGGIDYVLSRDMFPGVEKRVKDKIASLDRVTLIGRPYLPIGSAIVVPTQYVTSCLVSAPTMFLPHDVSMTRNAYHSLMAALCVTDKYIQQTDSSIDTLVCTSMCCGWGKMAPQEAASQMYQAFLDFAQGSRPTQISHVDDATVFLTQPRDDEQPNHYDNREIKDIF